MQLRDKTKIHPQLRLKVNGYIIKSLWVMYCYRDSSVKMICGICLFAFEMNKISPVGD